MARNSKPVSTGKFFILTVLSIAIVEFGIMLALEYLINLPNYIENFIDAISLILIVFPVLYYFAFKPLSDTEKAFEDSELKTKAILENIGDGVVAVNLGRRVLSVNKAAEKMLQLNESDLLGKALTDLRLEDEKGKIIPVEKRPLYMTLSQGKDFAEIGLDSSIYFIRKNKTKFPIWIISTPIILNNKTIGAIIVIRDLTREREIDKMKTDFISLASHQLRSPATSVKWNLEEVINENNGIDSKDLLKLKDAFQSNENMIYLINSLLNISRIENRSLISTSKPTKISELIRSVVKELKPEFDKNDIKLKIIIPDGIPVLSIDPELISNVYKILLSNGIKYSSRGSVLELSIMTEAKNLVSKVIDHGIGIPKVEQQHIFERFFRATNSRQKNPIGTGLGLYMARSIVEFSGGKMWFESAEGKGTTFYFSLPLS